MALLHRGEPPAGNFDHSRSPLRRASTPRPSISPLSVASKANKGSPIATRDAIMAQSELHGEMEKGLDSHDAETGEHPDDGSSSSLSEPDDDQDDLEQQDGTFMSIEDGEQLSAHQSVEVDSEAETERLEETPKKLRKHTDDVGRTPSKLSQAVTAEDELSEPPSPLPQGPGAASSTSTIGTTNKKRKRSDSADSSLTSAESDIAESPRKRSHESPIAPDEEEHTLPEDAAELEPEVRDEEGKSVHTTAISKPVKAKRGRQKGKKNKEALAEVERQQTHDTADVEEETGEETAAKTEEERQSKTEASSMFDEVSKKFFAFQEKLLDERLATANTELELLAQPDVQHPEFLRQIACVNARLEKQQREAHAFFHYRLRCIRERTLGERSQLHSQHYQALRDQRENVLYRLAEDWHDIQRERRQSHQEKDEGAYLYRFPTKKSVQIRQQAKYNQEVSVLAGIAKYVGWPAAPNITAADSEGLENDFKAMKIPKRVFSTVTTTAANPPQQTLQHPPIIPRALPIAQQAQTQSDRDAHQQFIDQNAWAQPQRPSIIHHHGHSNGIGTPNLTHTPDWVDSVGVRNPLIRNGAGGLGGSPYSTPVPQKRSLGLVGADGAATSHQNHDRRDTEGDASVSVLAAASSTGERTSNIGHPHQHYHPRHDTSPPALSIAKSRQNGGHVEEVGAGGARNISNLSHLSGASTIDATSSPPDSTEKQRQWMMGSKRAIPSSNMPMSHESLHASTPMQQHQQQQSLAHHQQPQQRDSQLLAESTFMPIHHYAHTPSHQQPREEREGLDLPTPSQQQQPQSMRRDIFSNDNTGGEPGASIAGFRPLSVHQQHPPPMQEG